MRNVREWNEVKENIIFRFGYKGEDLTDKVTMDYLDLKIVFAIYITELIDGNADTIQTCLVTENLMEDWNKDVNDLFEAAKVNTPRILDVSVKGIFDVISECLNIVSITDDVGMYVCTNKYKIQGSVCMLNEKMLEKFAEKLNNFYIIPCSIHEIIILMDCVDKDYVREMIMNVNTTELPENEILSDSLYYYDAETKKIKIA